MHTSPTQLKDRKAEAYIVSHDKNRSIAVICRACKRHLSQEAGCFSLDAMMASITKPQALPGLISLRQQISRRTSNWRPKSRMKGDATAQRNFSSDDDVKCGQRTIRAAYYRGGTSRGLMIKTHRLPEDRDKWDPILRSALGSPDPSGRQLDGLGAGISSLSKVCVVDKSERCDADVIYTFVQVGVKKGELDYSSNCGNMSAAVGPFAINSAILKRPPDGETEVRIFNTNTNKIIKARFQVKDGEALTEGDFCIDGVAGSSAKIELAFQDPVGSRTGKLLPTGKVVDNLEFGIEASCIDVANPCVFVRAEDFEVDGTILPAEGDAHPTLITRLEKIRRKGAVKMHLAKDEESVPEAAPKLVMVSPSAAYTTLSGRKIEANESDLVIRSLSGTNLHRAVQMTVALATAAAAKIPGSIVEQCLSKTPIDQSGITLGHASGKMMVTAKFDDQGLVTEATVFRTARRLFEGTLYWT
jgi:2-methylaconitate cis-trans-isomerase PrpF